VISVLLAEDQHLVRGALRALIELEDDLEVVVELERGDEVVAAARRARPDVAVLDIDLPGVDGLSAAQQLGKDNPGVHVLILTGLSQPGYAARAMRAGVTGFLRKDAPPDELADAIRRVARGQRFIDPALVLAELDAYDSPLTPRESDVLRAAADGAPITEVAASLVLSPATVRNHISNAIHKLGARNRMDAVRLARNAGWL
jgi:two-component system response regulator DesR